MMPCVAKKTEIARKELMNNGVPDIDVVLTVRETAALLKSRGIDWSALPGKHSTAYDPPFDISSGGGALFATSGGVMEAAMRVAYTVLSRHDITQSNASVFEKCRAVLTSGEWLSDTLDVTPGTRHSRPISVAVVSGSRGIQKFLKEQGLAEVGAQQPEDVKHFVEMMACPNGCIGGGGQPQTLGEHVLEMRRASVHRVDAGSKQLSPMRVQQDFVRSMFHDINSDIARQLLEYDVPPPGSARSPLAIDSPRVKLSDTAKSESVHTFSIENSSVLGEVVILVGTQSGTTSTYARRLAAALRSQLGIHTTVHPMNQFPLNSLGTVGTLVVLTSTWESDRGLMPHNAIDFYHGLCTSRPELFNDWLCQTRLAVCGFGSTKYTYFCGFADQIQDALVALGANTFLDLAKVDVDSADKGREKWNSWMKSLINSLMQASIAPPKYLLVPAITPGGRAVTTVAVGYLNATVTKTKQYKEDQTAGAQGKYFYMEVNTGKLPVRTTPDDSVMVLPCNPKSDVENLINTLYPNMLNVSVSLIPVDRMASPSGSDSIIPAHLTIRQLFTQYLDISHKPSRFFVEKMEQLLRDSAQDPKLFDVLASPEAFRKWASDQSYASVLLMYRSVAPPLELLISMIPVMSPRCYTPMLLETPQIGTLGFCFKVIDKGLCSRFLASLKKGDSVQMRIGKSTFVRPMDPFLNPKTTVYAPRPAVSLEWGEGNAPDLSSVASNPSTASNPSPIPAPPEVGGSPSSPIPSSPGKGSPLMRSSTGGSRKQTLEDSYSKLRLNAPIGGSPGTSATAVSELFMEADDTPEEKVLFRWLKNHHLDRYTERLREAGCGSLEDLVSDKCKAIVQEHRKLRAEIPFLKAGLQLCSFPWEALVAANVKTRRPPKITAISVPTQGSVKK